MASAVTAEPSGIRLRTSAALAGSPTSGPSGVRLPMVSPQTTAAKAVRNGSADGRSRQSRHATARRRNRNPPIAITSSSPQPTCRTSAAISATPTLFTT
jgi:hypothetical protein